MEKRIRKNVADLHSKWYGIFRYRTHWPFCFRHSHVIWTAYDETYPWAAAAPPHYDFGGYHSRTCCSPCRMNMLRYAHNFPSDTNNNLILQQIYQRQFTSMFYSIAHQIWVKEKTYTISEPQSKNLIFSNMLCSIKINIKLQYSGKSFTHNTLITQSLIEFPQCRIKHRPHNVYVMYTELASVWTFINNENNRGFVSLYNCT